MTMKFVAPRKMVPFPKRLIDGQEPQRLSWRLKPESPPFVYWNGIGKTHEYPEKPAPLMRAA